MTGTMKDLLVGLDGTQVLSLLLSGDYRDEYAKLKGQPLDIKIERHRKKRSLDANAYAWALMTKLAQAMKPPLNKEQVYREMLKRYGQGGMVSIERSKATDVIRAFDHWEYRGTSETNGKQFLHFFVCVGSSKYNSKEMTTFIDGIISECKEIGIDTDTPMQRAWLEQKEKETEKS